MKYYLYMKGLKIIINDKDVINIASDRVAGIFINIGESRQNNYIHIGGLDSKSYHLTWLEKEIKIGDKIKVKVSEINEITPLKERIPSDRSELVNKYHMLEKELKERGLI